ncbi:unnamed protein product, partial [Larinioides sclopetarius]
FQVRKNKAYATIYLSIEKEYRTLISEVDDGAQDWQILQKHFRSDSPARVIALTDEFFSCKISEVEDIGLYAARLKNIINDLKDAGKPIADWYQAFQLIRWTCGLSRGKSGKMAKSLRWRIGFFSKIKLDGILDPALMKTSNDQTLM